MTEREHLDLILSQLLEELLQCTRRDDSLQTIAIWITLTHPRNQFLVFANNLFLVDANNLYGGVKQLDKLPNADYILRSHITLSEILNTPDDAQGGYFVEVDLSYTTYLHDDQRDFRLAPTKDFVEDAWLSDYQIELKEQHNLPTSKVMKLLQTLFDKEKYIVNYKLLKLYVDLGLIVKKLYRVLQFRQEQ